MERARGLRQRGQGGGVEGGGGRGEVGEQKGLGLCQEGGETRGRGEGRRRELREDALVRCAACVLVVFGDGAPEDEIAEEEVEGEGSEGLTEGEDLMELLHRSGGEGHYSPLAVPQQVMTGGGHPLSPLYEVGEGMTEVLFLSSVDGVHEVELSAEFAPEEVVVVLGFAGRWCGEGWGRDCEVGGSGRRVGGLLVVGDALDVRAELVIVEEVRAEVGGERSDTRREGPHEGVG